MEGDDELGVDDRQKQPRLQRGIHLVKPALVLLVPVKPAGGVVVISNLPKPYEWATARHVMEVLGNVEVAVLVVGYAVRNTHAERADLPEAAHLELQGGGVEREMVDPGVNDSAELLATERAPGHTILTVLALGVLVEGDAGSTVHADPVLTAVESCQHHHIVEADGALDGTAGGDGHTFHAGAGGAVHRRVGHVKRLSVQGEFMTRSS